MKRITVISWLAAAATVLCAALGGCAHNVNTNTPAVADNPPVFFPPAPEEPHVQFLCNLSGSKNFEKPQGWLERFILGERPPSEKTIVKPFGVAVHDGKIYVADSGSACVAVLDMVSQSFETFGTTDPGRLKTPINLCFDGEGLLYVSDTGRNQVVVFDANRTYVTAYGRDENFRPADVLVLGNEVYVLNILEHNILVFDKNGRELKRTIGSRGREPGQFNYPSNFTADRDGNVYVSDSLNFRIQEIDSEGTPLVHFGKPGRTPGCFARPRGIAVDRDGIVYVVDSGLHVVHLFTHDGKPLMFIGGAGEKDGQLVLPAQVTVDYDNVDLFRDYFAPDFHAKYLVLVTNQIGKNKVSVFAFGARKTVASPTPQ